jgi:hypothetical protein
MNLSCCWTSHRTSISQLTKFPSVYRTRRLITIFTRLRQFWIQPTPSLLVSLRCSLLSFHLFLDRVSDVFRPWDCIQFCPLLDACTAQGLRVKLKLILGFRWIALLLIRAAVDTGARALHLWSIMEVPCGRSHCQFVQGITACHAVGPQFDAWLPPASVLKNFAFCPPNSINRLVSVAETECVSYEVRTECLYVCSRWTLGYRRLS